MNTPKVCSPPSSASITRSPNPAAVRQGLWRPCRRLQAPLDQDAEETVSLLRMARVSVDIASP